jgi:hypothetical protein
MNKARTALIDTAFGPKAAEAKEALYLVAKQHKASVDDVIQSGLGRGGTPAGADAAQHLKTFGFDFAPLEAAGWPFVCGECNAFVPALERCGECGAKCGPECLTIHGCPACTAKTQARIARGQEATAEQEATRKWMKRQLAEELPEAEPEPIVDEPPAVPEHIIPPPDRVEPVGEVVQVGMVPPEYLAGPLFHAADDSATPGEGVE